MALVQLGIFLPLSVVCLATQIGLYNFLVILSGFITTFVAGALYLFLSLEKSADYQARNLQHPRERYQSQSPQPRLVPVQTPPLESQIKIISNPQNEKRVQLWYTGTLKQNQLIFLDKATSKRGVVCLDGCVVTIMKTRKGGFFHIRNYLRLEHPGRPLLPDPPQYQLFLYFQSSKEMEEWYYALERAAFWATNRTPELSLFRRFSTELKFGKYGQPMDASWFTAFAHRFFFNYYDNPRLIDPLGKLINKKFRQLPLPDMIRSWTVHQIQFGASLPHLNNIHLLYVRPDGSMGFSASMRYFGGLHFRIELVVESKFLTLVFDKKTIPAVFDFSLNSCAGDIEVHFNAPPCDSIWFGFKSNPTIKMQIETAFDSDHTHIPKLGGVLKELIRSEVKDKYVLPNMESIPMPKLSKKHARKKENWAWASEAAKEYKPFIEMDELRTPKKSSTHFQPIDFSSHQASQPKNPVASSTLSTPSYTVEVPEDR